MNYINKLLLTGLVMLSAVAKAFCGGEVEKWIIDAYEAHKIDAMPYRLLRPLSLEPGKLYPVIISLHGKGGTGSDNLEQLREWNGVLADAQTRKAYPAYVVAPQTTKLWNANDLKSVQSAIAALPSVDKDRIYILGFSMGGRGTYEFIQLAPAYFAAAAPASGSGLADAEDFVDVSKIKDIPIWAFHGDLDTKCPIDMDLKIFANMKAIGGNMKFTTLAGEKHNSTVPLHMLQGSKNGTTQLSSDRCDPEPVFMKWLFSQKKTH